MESPKSVNDLRKYTKEQLIQYFQTANTTFLTSKQIIELTWKHGVDAPMIKCRRKTLMRHCAKLLSEHTEAQPVKDEELLERLKALQEEFVKGMVSSSRHFICFLP